MPSEHYGDYQMEIYLDGLHGKLPRFPVDHESLEAAAVEVLPSWVYSYVGYGAGDGRTQQANVDAFGRYAIVPRMLVAPTERDLSVSLFDMQLPTPLFMPPVGVVGVCSQDMHGDIAAAKASAITGVPMVASTLTQDRMEEVRPHSGETPNLFQLYTANDKELARSFLRRAEQSGYKAVAVTLDTWITGWRPHDLNMANFPQMRGYCLQNYFTDEVFRARLSKTPEEDPGAAALEWAKVFGHPVRWEDLGWLRESTKLPMLLKGILHPDDVRKARDHGIDGIYCSNHGGRQANGGLPALDALPAVVKAAESIPVLFDSGVRSGSDVAKALALGATAVGIGRTYLYALAIGGVDGLVSQLRSVLAELDLLMAVDGFPSIADLRAAGAQRI
jgi:lactate 2-monooxygenase